MTAYWCSRLILINGKKPTQKQIIDNYIKQNNPIPIREFINFKSNIITLGYPKSTDTKRVLKLEHKGIEIRTGNPEWGAEPNKLYFVIKHGGIIN